MSDPTIVLISIGITIALYPLYFRFIKRHRKSANDNDKAVIAKRDGVSATAISRKLKWHPGRYQEPRQRWKQGFWTVTYEYVVDGKAYKKKFIVDENLSGESPPSEITVYYLPDNPKAAYTEDQVSYRSNRQIGCLVVIAIPMAFMALMFYIIRAVF